MIGKSFQMYQSVSQKVLMPSNKPERDKVIIPTVSSLAPTVVDLGIRYFILSEVMTIEQVSYPSG